jgi:hypothetical protein
VVSAYLSKGRSRLDPGPREFLGDLFTELHKLLRSPTKTNSLIQMLKDRNESLEIIVECFDRNMLASACHSSGFSPYFQRALKVHKREKF